MNETWWNHVLPYQKTDYLLFFIWILFSTANLNWFLDFAHQQTNLGITQRYWWTVCLENFEWMTIPTQWATMVCRSKKRWKAVIKITMKGFMHFPWEEQEALRCDLLDLRLKQRSVWVQSFAKVAKVHQDVTSLVETEAVRWQWQYPAATRKQ